MKLIKLEILTNTVTEETDDSYNNVLAELNIKNDDYLPNENSYFRPVWLNVKVLEDEMMTIYARYEVPENSIIEFFDGRTMIINMTADELAKLLCNDTN